MASRPRRVVYCARGARVEGGVRGLVVMLVLLVCDCRESVRWDTRERRFGFETPAVFQDIGKWGRWGPPR